MAWLRPRPAVLLLKPFYSPGRIHQFLLPGKEGMAAGTDFQTDLGFRRASLKLVATGTGYQDLVILGMNAFFHVHLCNSGARISLSGVRNKLLVYARLSHVAISIFVRGMAVSAMTQSRPSPGFRREILGIQESQNELFSTCPFFEFLGFLGFLDSFSFRPAGAEYVAAL